MSTILPQIKHIVVVMLENRSLDNLCGWLYAGGPAPSLYLPAGSPQSYNGLHHGLFNPVDKGYFDGTSTRTYPIFDSATATTTPNPDPEETFDNVSYQLYGPEPPSEQPKWPNLGFVVNYALVTGTNIPVEIMEPFSPEQVPVLSALAWNFAISDAWYCSVPSQTWPNRSFFHAGTSNGHVNNGTLPNPFDWDVRNIFNVLEDIHVDWKVYSHTVITPSLTRIMYPNLWDPFLDGHFHGFDDFVTACATNKLPAYSFLEPSFLFDPNDEHPPHDVVAGEQFLYQIWQAVSSSPAWNETLFVITFDEHGGTYDHVMPPWGAVSPDAVSNPGSESFPFNRFGVRVPTIVVSPWVQAGTVFRSDTAVPYDHTSMLATLRDWLGISPASMLTSARIAAAPNLAQVLSLSSPRTSLPAIPPPPGEPAATSDQLPPNDLQRSIISGTAIRLKQDPAATLGRLPTRQHAIEYFRSHPELLRR